MTAMLQAIPAPPPPEPPPVPEVIIQGGGMFGLEPYQITELLQIVLFGTFTVIIALPFIRLLTRWVEARFLHPARAEELEELRARMGELESQQARMLELENRLEFAERLLLQQREGQSIGRGP